MGTLIIRILVSDVLVPDYIVAFYDHIDDQKKNIWTWSDVL